MSSSCLQISSTSRRVFTFSLVPSLLTVTGDEHILITGEADAQVRLTPAQSPGGFCGHSLSSSWFEEDRVH